MGPADSTTCHNNFTAIQQTCRNLGIPLALEKLESPSHSLTFLGIEIDTIRMEAHLPEVKLILINKQLTTWLKKGKQKRGKFSHWSDPYSMQVRLYNQDIHSQQEFTAQQPESNNSIILLASTKPSTQTCNDGTLLSIVGMDSDPYTLLSINQL